MKLRLGDRVEKLIEKTVPKSVINYVKEKDGGCGCGKRKATLNKLDDIFN